MTRWNQIVSQFTAGAEGRAVFVLPPSVKFCTKCGQMKPRTEFYSRPQHSIDSLQSHCKPCHIASQKERAKAKKAARRAAMTPEQKAAEAERQRAKARKRNAAQKTGNFDWPGDA